MIKEQLSIVPSSNEQAILPIITMPRKTQEDIVPVSSDKERGEPVEITKNAQSALSEAFEDYLAGGESGRSGLNKVIREIVRKLED